MHEGKKGANGGGGRYLNIVHLSQPPRLHTNCLTQVTATRVILLLQCKAWTVHQKPVHQKQFLGHASLEWVMMPFAVTNVLNGFTLTLCVLIGLPEKVIDDIVNHEGNGILSLCLNCRLYNQFFPSNRGSVGNLDQNKAVKSFAQQLGLFSLINWIRSLLLRIKQVHLPWLIREEIRELQDHNCRTLLFCKAFQT